MLQRWLTRVNNKEKVKNAINATNRSTDSVESAKKPDKKVTSVLLQISRRQTLTTSSKNQLNHKGFNVCCH